MAGKGEASQTPHFGYMNLQTITKPDKNAVYPIFLCYPVGTVAAKVV